MSVTLPVSLGKDEVTTGRPFTHTDHMIRDREILVHMARQLGLILEKHPDSPKMIGPININELDGRSHRYFVPRPTVLTQIVTIYLVGFFCHKRKGVSSNHFGNLDDRLIEQIPSYQGILSYSTMALPNGNFGNLVLISDEEIKSKWLQGEIHNQAIVLSHDYYQYVRINNGMLPEGIKNPDSLRITRVKYYDYTENPPWKAVRELTQG